MSPLLLRPLLASEVDLDSEFNMGGDGSAQLMQAAAAANHAQAIIITLLEEYNNIFRSSSESEELSDDYDDEDDEDDDADYSSDGSRDPEHASKKKGERCLTLKHEVATLKEQLQRERKLRMILKVGLMMSKNILPLPGSIDDQSDVEDIAQAEAEVISLQQKVDDLEVQLNHGKVLVKLLVLTCESVARYGVCDYVCLYAFMWIMWEIGSQSIECDHLNKIGMVVRLVEFISFTFGDKEMILVI
ncbi:Rho GTPase-activating protein REN1-like protein isoform X1 [Tanacetum coccineum]